MKKHYVLKNKKRFYSIIITLSIVLMTSFFATSAYASKEQDYNTVVVKGGDTLWSIAGKYCKGSDIRRNIFEIKKINHLTSSIIYVGDLVKIPK